MCEKAARVIRGLVDADGHDLESSIAEFTLQLVHERKGFPTRRTPGGPKIEVHDFALVVLDANNTSIVGGPCRTRRRDVALGSRQCCVAQREHTDAAQGTQYISP